jgi:hypothetical protein
MTIRLVAQPGIPSGVCEEVVVVGFVFEVVVVVVNL